MARGSKHGIQWEGESELSSAPQPGLKTADTRTNERTNGRAGGRASKRPSVLDSDDDLRRFARLSETPLRLLNGVQVLVETVTTNQWVRTARGTEHGRSGV